MKSERGSAGFVGFVSVAALVFVLLMTGCGTFRAAGTKGTNGTQATDGASDAAAKAKALLVPVVKLVAKLDPQFAPYAGIVLPYLGSEEDQVPKGFGALYRYRAFDTNGVSFALDPARGIDRDTWYYKADNISLNVKASTPIPSISSDLLTEIDRVRSNMPPDIGTQLDSVLTIKEAKAIADALESK